MPTDATGPTPTEFLKAFFARAPVGPRHWFFARGLVRCGWVEQFRRGPQFLGAIPRTADEFRAQGFVFQSSK